MPKTNTVVFTSNNEIGPREIEKKFHHVQRYWLLTVMVKSSEWCGQPSKKTFVRAAMFKRKGNCLPILSLNNTGSAGFGFLSLHQFPLFWTCFWSRNLVPARECKVAFLAFGNLNNPLSQIIYHKYENWLIVSYTNAYIKKNPKIKDVYVV